MPPALQMLQDLLGGDSSSDEETTEKPETGQLLGLPSITGEVMSVCVCSSYQI